MVGQIAPKNLFDLRPDLRLLKMLSRVKERNAESLFAGIAGELERAAGGLDAMDTGDAGTDVRAAFSWSHRSLPEPARRLFRLLSLHPGPDLTGADAAALGGTDVSGALSTLAELTRAQMLRETSPGRYAFHDLLRLGAMPLAVLEGVIRERMG